MNKTRKEKQISHNIDLYYRETKGTNVIETLKKKRIEQKQRSVPERIYGFQCDRIKAFFKKHNISSRGRSYRAVIGGDYNIIKEHLESQFKEGMTFDNFGEWEVDHIYPVSKINPKDDVEIFKYFNYSNLRPLSKKDNRIKSNKILD